MYVAPPMRMGAWSMARVLRQRIYSHDKSRIYTMTAKLGVTIGKCVHNTLKVKLHCKYNIVYRVYNMHYIRDRPHHLYFIYMQLCMNILYIRVVENDICYCNV